jgi:hypothetical protein
MNKKGMMPMDMHLLLMSLEAIKHVCTHEKAKSESSKKASHKGEKGKECPGTKSTARVPKKVHFKKHCDLCKKHGGAYTMHNTCDCCRFEKDGKEKSKFHAAKKGSKKANPFNQNFEQLTKKIKKLEKALEKSSKKAQKHQYEDSDSNSKEGVGLGSTRKLVKLGETIEKTKFTPPSPMKAIPTTIASNSNGVSIASVRDAGDIMMTSPSQREELFNTNSILPNKDPPGGKTTAIIAVIGGKPQTWSPPPLQ